MNSLTLELRLLSDVVLTQQSATAGAPRSLDYIPGAVLLGACAAALYEHMSPPDAWTVFHSGLVRFGAGLPLTDAGPCLPMPLALHHRKGEPFLDAGGRLGARVKNGSRAVLPSGEPWRQLRQGFVAPDLTVLRPRHTQAQRTAMKAGRARDGFLYSIDALAAGSRYQARVSFDACVAQRLRDEIKQVLTGDELRLGRSRSAEFGRVQALVVQSDTPWARPSTAPGQPVLLFAASDLALRDPTSGAPTLVPSPRALGLPAGAFEWLSERSYLRTRRYSPFNSTRARPDLERQVVEAGSVIAVAPAADWSPERLEGALSTGVGDYRQDGLGELLVDPWLLAGEAPEPIVTPTPRRALQAPPPPAEDATWRWLVAEKNRRDERERALATALHWVDAMARWPALPASQWGEIRRFAAGARDRQDLISWLFDEHTGFTKTGVGKLQQRWGARAGGQVRSEAFEALLLGADETVVLEAVQLLATHIVRKRRKEVSR
jgi:CRISPR-associated protein Csx10